MKPVTNQRGFTLIEIIIAVAIFGILTAIAVPSFNVWQRNAQVRSDARLVMGAIQQARVDAITRSAVVTVTFNIVDGSWVVDEVGGAEIRDGRFPPESNSRFDNQSFAGTNNITMFDSRGLARDDANQPQDGSIQVVGARAYEISVSPAGNVSISLIP